MTNKEPQENTAERHFQAARTYDEMGLKDEALAAYEAALTLLPPEDPRRELIAERFQALRKNMASYSESAEGEEIPDLELSGMGNALDSQRDVSPILAAARALKAKNQWDKAADEYEKLLAMGYPASIVMPEYIACLVKTCPDRQILESIDRVIETPGYQKEKKASVCCLVGMELGGHGLVMDGLKYLLCAYKEDARERQYQRQMIRLAEQLAATPRYAHLISHGFADPAGIRKAAILAAKERKSIEWTLIHSMKVSRHHLLSALAQLYACPFAGEPAAPKSATVFMEGLRKADLLVEGWIPFLLPEGIVEVWMEDPGDARRMGWVRTRLDLDGFKYRVALREDIQKLLEEVKEEPKAPTKAASAARAFPDAEAAEAAAGPVEPVTPAPAVSMETVLDLAGAPPRPAPEDERRYFREQSIGPELITAQVFITDASGVEKEFNMKVENHTRNGLGLLVTPKDKALLSMVEVGDTLRNVMFYSGWAMLRVDAVVKHKTRLNRGEDGDTYILGVTSEELI